jgi:flavin-dependent dehydrogenase
MGVIMKKTDVVVIGAGPGGLIAAKTAAEKGLNVVLVEARKDISTITRTCCQIFYLTHIGSGQAYIKPVKAEIGTENKCRLLFPDIGLTVEYNGLLRACYDWRHLSPNGTCVYTAKNTLWGLVLDKGLLLQQLLDEVKRLGVTVRNGMTALDAENVNGGVKVTIRDSKGTTSSLEAKHAIVANGINSRIVESLGLNKDRKSLGMSIKIIGRILEGVECPYSPSSWVSFAYPSITPFINVWMGPMAEGTWQFAATAKVPDSAVNIMSTFLSTSNFVSWFKNAKIMHKNSCALTARYPIAEPVVGNIMIIGDAAAPAETWNQGALACGYQAARAIEEGNMQKYIAWWKESFHFNTPEYYEQLAKYPALNMFFNDDDLNYLYGLMDNQLVDSLVEETLRNAERIKAEKPTIYEKLKKVQEIASK